MKRDPKIDGLKFILIFLVVLGHIVYYDYGLHINRIIYAFHMPIFCFLSGFLTSSSPTEEKQRKWFWHTFKIYCFAQFAHAILSNLLGYKVTWTVLISPYLALWYLICLIYWRFSIWKTFSKWDDKWLLLFSIILAIGAGFIPIEHEFSFQRAFAFFPFFVAGFLFKKHQLFEKIETVPLLFPVIALLILFVIARIIPFNFMPRYHYHSLNEMFARMRQLGVAVAGCFCIICISRLPFLNYFSRWGKYTLWIYIGHTYLIVLLQWFLKRTNMHLNIFQAIPLAIIFCMIPLIAALLFTRHKGNDTPTTLSSRQ